MQHPYIFAMYNDGTYTLGDQSHDHRNHATSDRDAASAPGELNGCHASRVRNTNGNVAMRVRYEKGELSVAYRLPAGDGDTELAWQTCLFIPKITLPENYFFGFTAATGALADDHDIANITIVDIRDTAFSTPFGQQQQQQQQQQPVATATASGAPTAGLAELAAKLDGVADIVRDTLQTLASRQQQAAIPSVTAVTGNEQVGQVLQATRSIQSQVNGVSAQTQEILNVAHQLQTELRNAQAKPPPPPQQQQQLEKQKERERREAKPSSGGSVLHMIVFICLLLAGGASAYLYVQLQRERRQKKLF